MRQVLPKQCVHCVLALVGVVGILDESSAADYYLANKPGSGAGTKHDPFGLVDLPKPDNKLTRPLTVLQPGDTLWFKGGDNLIRGDMLAGHWAGELWNTRLGNNIVLSQGKAVIAYNESRNPFIKGGEKQHLAYMDYNVYTAPPEYTFGAYAQGGGQTFGMGEMRAHGFEQHSQVGAGSCDIYQEEQYWGLLPKWKTAGRDGGAVGPEDVALVLKLARYGPAGRSAAVSAVD